MAASAETPELPRCCKRHRHRGKEGILLSLRVTPRSSRTGALGMFGDSVKWGVRSAPVDGKANEELVRSIAEAADVSRSAVTIVSGESGRAKQIFIETDGEEAALIAALSELD